MTGRVVKRPARQHVGSPRFFATTAAGLEAVLAEELTRLGAREVVPAVRGVSFQGSTETLYRANLWLRTAHRVLWPLGEFAAPDREALYEGARLLPWSDHLTLETTFAIDAVSNRSQLDHTLFVSRVVKDAIVDGFRERTGSRPNVDPEHPDVRFNVRLHEDRATVSLDTSGERLHRRGYRPAQGPLAPLQETLAAGVLLLSGWRGAGTLVDPMCGSGTLLVEAALIARNVAPGLLGRHFGMSRHPAFDRKLWTRLVEEARALVDDEPDCRILGSDLSETALRTSRAAVLGAGVDDVVALRQADVREYAGRGDGLIVTNPPYGERLGDVRELGELYEAFGNVLKRRCVGMQAAILTGSPLLAKKIGLHPRKRDALWNGPIECRLLHFDLY